MVKNFFEYIKELVPEKGSVFFRGENHTTDNNLSLYDLADFLCGKRIGFCDDVVAYAWKVEEYWKYRFPTIGLMVWKKDYEKWLHFSQNAFFGTICIVATRNNVTFDDEEHEALRQTWERKINGKETKEDKEITGREEWESNFDNKLFVRKPAANPHISEEDLNRIKAGKYYDNEDSVTRYRVWKAGRTDAS